jgi:hypothetical protein
MRPRVYRNGPDDWVFKDQCDEVWCGTWWDAMEAAWGHIMMAHGGTWEKVGYYCQHDPAGVAHEELKWNRRKRENAPTKVPGTVRALNFGDTGPKGWVPGRRPICPLTRPVYAQRGDSPSVARS